MINTTTSEIRSIEEYFGSEKSAKGRNSSCFSMPGVTCPTWSTGLGGNLALSATAAALSPAVVLFCPKLGFQKYAPRKNSARISRYAVLIFPDFHFLIFASIGSCPVKSAVDVAGFPAPVFRGRHCMQVKLSHNPPPPLATGSRCGP